MPYFRSNVRSRGLQLFYAQDGARSDTPVLLIHGLGGQLVEWPPSLLQALVAAGLRVLRMDNRDVGLSDKLRDAGTPDLAALAAAMDADQTVDAPYSLSDMANDAIGLLDYLGQSGAHVVGMSMGGMIAQRMAIEHPERVFSITSIMSSSGAPGLPGPEPEAMAAMLSAPQGEDHAAIVAHQHQVMNVLSGPHYLSTEVGLARFAALAVERCYEPAGVARQIAAVASDRSRADALVRIRCPALVIHGDADPLVPLAAGEDTAKRIPGARLQVFANMGHDLPEPLLPDLAAAIITHIRTAPANR